MRIYLDSNVFIAFIRSETGGPFRLMLKQSEDFLLNCSERHRLVLSSLSLEEIGAKIYLPEEEIIAFFKKHNIPTKIIKAPKCDIEKAKEVERAGVHWPDSLHVVLALRAKCGLIVTWNARDFEKIKGLIRIAEPEELI